jgi:hypothetical protein
MLTSLARFFLCLILLAAITPHASAEPEFVFETGTPEWKGERLDLPPGFAPDLGWTGVEHIRFAPGMFKAGEPDFFSYVLVFLLEPGSDVSESALKRELLVYYRGLSKAVMAGKLPWPDYYRNQAAYHRCVWQPPGMESVDIARETKSLIDQVQSGLRSPQEIATARGRDLEEIYREIKEAKEMAEEMGLEFNLDSISTALANSPSAIEGQGIKEETEDETEETA